MVLERSNWVALSSVWVLFGLGHSVRGVRCRVSAAGVASALAITTKAAGLVLGALLGMFRGLLSAQ